MTTTIYTIRENADDTFDVLMSRPYWIATVANREMAEALIAWHQSPPPGAESEPDRVLADAEPEPDEAEAAAPAAAPIDHGEDGIEIDGVLYSAALRPLPDQADGIWTDEKDAWLEAAMDEEMPLDQIARILGHTPNACKQRYWKLMRDATKDKLGVAV